MQLLAKIARTAGNMANKCSVCGRLVAGHQKFGCLPGPGNCTLPPLTPGSSGDSSLEITVVTSADSNPITSAPSTSVSNVPISLANSVSNNVSTSEPTSEPAPGPSTSQDVLNAHLAKSDPSVCVTNEHLEATLQSQVAILEAQLKQAESKRTADNIQKLYAKQNELQTRLAQITGSTSCPPVTTMSAPPAVTSVTWAAQTQNLFVPPSTTSGISAASFGASAISQSQLAPSAVSSGASLSNPFMPTVVNQSQLLPPHLRNSTPNLHNDVTAASLSVPPLSANARGSQIHSQSLPNIASLHNPVNMASFNPNENPFATSDDIFEANPLVRAILGIHNDSREESASLGKYIPELFSLKFGSINEIRSKMSYQEFMAMYTRMLMYMLRDDPHLVPDRLIFLYNLSKKAARYRWQDVRDIYAVAMHELKIKRRKWSDDWKEITEDTLEKDPRRPPVGPRPSSQPGSRQQYFSRMVSPLDSTRPLCADYNDRSCNRYRCKFHHECASCGAAHPRQACHNNRDARQHDHNGGPPPSGPSM